MKIYKKDFKWTQVTIDRMGRTFSDDQFFYRGIYHFESQVHRVKKMFSCGLIDLLVEREFILPVEMTDLEFADTNEFGIILRSKKIKNILFPTEWSYSMLLDAAEFMIRLEKELLQHKYTLHDYHPYNVIFVGNKPYHCDLGSIFMAQRNSEDHCFREMLVHYYRPLCQWRQKKENITSELFLCGDTTIGDEDWFRFLYGNLIGDKIKKLKDTINGSKKMSFEILEKKISKLENFYRKTENGHQDWSHYQDEYFNEDGTIKSNPRFEAIAQLLKKYEIKEITELAANQGVFSQYCLEEKIIHSSLAVDYDEWAVDRMYCRLKGTDTGKRISMGVVDLVEPKCADFLESRNRMTNQAVLALALTHHLILTQGMSVEAAIDRICGFSEQYIFIEFMPLGLYERHKNIPLKRFPSDYSLEMFKEILSRKCRILEEISLEVNRVLFVGEKRGNNEK